MPYVVGVSTCTPIVFGEETLHTVGCGCVNTYTIQRGYLTCRTLWVWARPQYSERKPYVPYIVGVNTPIVFREETLRAVHCGCEHTHSIQRRNLTCRTLWVWSHPYLLGGSVIALHALRHGYDFTHATFRLLWKRCGCQHTRNVKVSVFTEISVWKRWVCGHPRRTLWWVSRWRANGKTS